MKVNDINIGFMSVSALVRLGVHYGHKITLLRSVMRPYVLGSWCGVNILNVDKTLAALETGLNIVFEAICANSHALFLCNGLKYPRSVANALSDVGQYCVVKEFGGIVSNWFTFKGVGARIERYHKVINAIKDKRLIAYYNRRAARAAKPFISAPRLEGLPGAIVLFCSADVDRVILEANKAKVPVIGLADTFSRVSGVDCVVPVCEGSVEISTFMCELFADVCSKAVLVSKRARLLGVIIDSEVLCAGDFNTAQALATVCCHFKATYLVSDNIVIANQLARLANVLDVSLTLSVLMTLLSAGLISPQTSLRSVINLFKHRLLTIELSATAATRLRLLIRWLECVRCLVSIRSKVASNAVSAAYGKFSTPDVKAEKHVPLPIYVKDLHTDYHNMKYPDLGVIAAFDYFFNLSK